MTGDASTSNGPGQGARLHLRALHLLHLYPHWTAADLAAELALSEAWVTFLITTDVFSAARAAGFGAA